ncbi:FAD-dependent oxidoreductase [Streptomyces sp. NPDC026672]|uniref:NAD(P)/FAD-dependent oxidoreductase n=1 Tax=unclassified Streptomyces TaxID=2593676 RepID=UPI0033EC2910
MREIVVVGASAAGVAAARTLRSEGFDGTLTVVGAEDRVPYDRPPLSKQFLTGAWDAEKLAIPRPDGVTWRLGSRATVLDPERRRVTLGDGSHLGYDGLVIATGVASRTLPFSRGLAGVHVLRTLDDAEALRAGMLASGSLVVVGAGFLGAEAAAVARELGLAVTLVDLQPAPMIRPLGPLVAERLRHLHTEAGVDLRMGTAVRELHGTDHVTAVELTDGSVIPTAAVLVAAGAVPATGWLEGSGLPLGDGVECDAYCRAAPGIVAAGDVAAWLHPDLGRRIRLEHRMNATEHAAAAARTLLGRGRPFAPVPYFWTDQYHVRIQAYGTWDASIEPDFAHGAAGDDRFVLVQRRDGRITAALGWNAPREIRTLRAAIGTTG